MVGSHLGYHHSHPLYRGAACATDILERGEKGVDRVHVINLTDPF